MKKPVLYIVIPCYNEEEVLEETTRRITAIIERMVKEDLVSEESRMLPVDDGSRDRTWEIIERLHAANPLVGGVKLAANSGHQNALLAGLFTACEKADIMVSIDADLQDDVEVIPEMVRKYLEGNDVVYGVRKSRATDTWFKRTTALGFYKFMRTLGVKSVYNHADYRLMSRRAVRQLSNYRERNLFLRGLVPLVGYKSDKVYYDRAKRFAGESKYPLQHPAPPPALPHRLAVHPHLLLHLHLGALQVFHRRRGDGMVITHPIHLVRRRHYPHRTWHHRRVYRQDVHGGEGPSALQHRGDLGMILLSAKHTCHQMQTHHINL